MATERRLIAFDPITFESFARHATKHREPDACQYDMGYVDAFDQIDDWMDANTVDAVEVVHGRWIRKAHDGAFGVFHLWHCSVCDTIRARQDPYCGECGAKMDMEVDNG